MSEKSAFSFFKLKPFVYIILSVFLFSAAVFSGVFYKTEKNCQLYRFILKEGYTGSDYINDFSSDAEIYTQFNCTVQVRLFESKKDIYISEIDKILPKADPRRDKYVNNIKKLFYTADGRNEVVYIRSDKSRMAFLADYGSFLKKNRDFWISPDISFMRFYLLSACAAVFLLFASLLYAKEIKSAFFYFLPWTGLVFSLDFQMLFMGFCFSFAVVKFVLMIYRIFRKDEKIAFSLVFRKNRMLWYLLVALVFMAALFILISRSARSVLLMASVILFQFTITFLFFRTMKKRGRITYQEHFRVVPIKGNVYSFVNRTPVYTDLFILVALLFFQIFTPSIKTEESGNIAEFREYKSDYSLLERETSQNDLYKDTIQLTDYASHDLYQKYYQYGYKEKTPKINTAFSVNRFTESANDVIKTKDKMFIFTDSLYSDILSDIPDKDAARLLFNRGIVNVYTFTSSINRLHDYSGLWLFFVAVLLTFFPLLITNIFFRPAGKSRTSITEIRRSKKYA